MKLIIGLGNPGEKYMLTRHNAGFLFVDYLYDQAEIVKPWKFDKYANAELAEVTVGNNQITLVKPQTFMNRSGESVTKLAIRYSISPSDTFVAHDDLDIKLGDHKISLGKGPKLHNGVSSIESLWKTKEFWRIRIGVDNRTDPIPGETYVLQNFLSTEIKSLRNVFSSIENNVITA